MARSAHLALVENSQRPAEDRLALQEHVAIDIELIDQRQVLIDRLDAERARMADRAKLNGLALEVELPGARLIVAGEDLHQGRLAGAVVSEQSQDLAAAEPQIDVLERRDPSEGFLDVLGAQHLRSDVEAGIILLPVRATESGGR